ncbi:MAG: hypothetical protein WDM94_00770 [Bauldia sp.]
MAEIVKFRSRAELVEEELDLDIDLVTAVDAAIRDLREIVAKWGDAAMLQQAQDCQRMLERALAAAF